MKSSTCWRSSLAGEVRSIRFQQVPLCRLRNRDVSHRLSESELPGRVHGKIANFVSECQRMGIEILPPDINKSALKFAPESGAIRYGLSAIKNVGEGAMQAAITEREANGEFRSLEDFASRLDSKAVNKKMLEALIKTGAFDFTGEPRLVMFNRMDQVLASAASAQKDRRSGQASLFDFDMGAPPSPKKAETKNGRGKAAAVEPPPEWPKMELIAFEKELLGFYVSGHPLDAYRGNFDSNRFTKIAAIEEITQRTIITVGGLISVADVRYSKKDNRPFATLKIEDFTGAIEAMCWSDDYEKFKEHIVVGSVVEMRATCDKDQRTEMNKLTVRDIKPLKPKKASARQLQAATEPEAPAELPSATPQLLQLTMRASHHDAADVAKLRGILKSHPGEVPVRIDIVRRDDSIVSYEVSKEYRVTQTTDLLQRLSEWL